MPGFWELVVLLVILVIVFGARQLPALGEAVGRAIVRFRSAAASREEIQVQPATPPAPDDPGADDGGNQRDPKDQDVQEGEHERN